MKDNLDERELEKYITQIILALGIPAHLLGYHYLRDAIMIVCLRDEILGSITKQIYPEVAKHFQTTSQRVERAIRNAIEVSWNRANLKEIEEIFGYSVDFDRGKPTNSEYIARVADKIRLDYQ